MKNDIRPPALQAPVQEPGTRRADLSPGLDQAQEISALVRLVDHLQPVKAAEPVAARLHQDLAEHPGRAPGRAEVAWDREGLAACS